MSGRASLKGMFASIASAGVAWTLVAADVSADFTKLESHRRNGYTMEWWVKMQLDRQGN